MGVACGLYGMNVACIVYDVCDVCVDSMYDGCVVYGVCGV